MDFLGWLRLKTKRQKQQNKIVNNSLKEEKNI